MASFFQVSERSHAGLLFMTELALGYSAQQTVTLAEVAQAKQVSQGYLEEIAHSLKQAGLITGKKGPGGGYLLTRAPAQITAEDVLVALEGPIELVGCQQAPGACPVEARCSSRFLWARLQTRMRETLRSMTLAELVHPSS